MKLTALVAVVALALAGCGSSTPATAPTSAAKPTADASAELSCTHFRNVWTDATAGILTDEELRAKIKEVYGTAWVSENAGIPGGARSMLAAVTAGDATAFVTAALAFSNACKRVGL